MYVFVVVCVYVCVYNMHVHCGVCLCLYEKKEKAYSDTFFVAMHTHIAHTDIGAYNHKRRHTRMHRGACLCLYGKKEQAQYTESLFLVCDCVSLCLCVRSTCAHTRIRYIHMHIYTHV